MDFSPLVSLVIALGSLLCGVQVMVRVGTAMVRAL
jgi:hypothetical protein